MQAVMLHIMNKYGYLGVCFLIAVETDFPLQSENKHPDTHMYS